MLGKGAGVFDLSNSDHCVGSFLSKKDLLKILAIDEDWIANLKSHEINGEITYNEKDIHKFWYDKNPIGLGNKISFDEFILSELFRRTYPNAVISRQERIKRFTMDLTIELDGVKKYIEFDGPSHFAAGRFGQPNADPFRKKYIVEDATGCEVVNWPYWVQRCEANVRAAMTGSGAGYGALWSTTCHFGDFAFEESANIILTMSRRFGIPETDGFGHFYGPSTLGRNNPEHPIIQRILDGKENVGRLIPKGAKERKFWLPEKLKE
jgi:hypothetical protein